MKRSAVSRLLAVIFAVVFLLGFWLLPVRRRTPPTSQISGPHVSPRPPLQGITVILDPGHGGEDPGAVCPYGVEAAYTYRAALEIGQVLRAQGATVLSTVHSRALDPAFCARSAALPVPRDATLVADGQPIRARHSPRQLWLRVAPARRAWKARTGAQADRHYFFLSLHMDDSSDPNVHGGLVCVDRRRPTPMFGMILAQGLARKGFLRSNTDFRGYPGLSGHQFGVLNPQYNPIPQSVLLEMTTLSHSDDLLQAADPVWRQQIAQQIASAITLACQERTLPRFPH